MVSIGTVAETRLYPLKSAMGYTLRGTMLLESDSQNTGFIVGDRVWAVRDAASGRIVTGKQAGFTKLMNVQVVEVGSLRLVIEGNYYPLEPANHALADQALGDYLQCEVTLVHVASLAPSQPVQTVRPQLVMDPGTFRDAQPVHLLTTASLRRLGNQLGREVYARRFRYNLLIATLFHADDENDWIGKTLGIGEVRLAIRKPTARCAMPALPFGIMPADHQLLGALKRHHGNNFGVYARVIVGGGIRAGDKVQLLED